METGSPPVDSSNSSEYDDDNEVSSGVDETCLADDPYIVENFTGLNKIGKGGYGSVYEAVSIHDGKKYALKFVKLETDLDYREVQVLQSLDHKNVLKYYKHWFADLDNISNSSLNSKPSEEDDTSCSLEIKFTEELEIDNNPKKINTVTKFTTSNMYPMSTVDDEIKNATSVSNISNANLKISEEDDATNTASSTEGDYNTDERKNLNLKISAEDDATNTASSPERIYNTYKKNNATSVSTSNANPKISEEDDATNTASSPEGDFNINERNNANSVSTSTSRRFKSSEEEHVPSYLDFDYLVIQTELCQPTVNLKVLIKSKKVFNMNENQRRKLFLEIVYGLQHIHDKRIIHRDLKPANILIGIDDQEAKIADFGLARIYNMSHADENSSTSKTDKDSLTLNIGTLTYMAPEVKKLKVYSYKADLFSLGLILSEMYLEMGSGRSRIIGRLRSEDFTDLKNIPDEVVKVIKSLLTEEPWMRMELERVIDIMSPLEYHQRVKVEADQTEDFRSM